MNFRDKIRRAMPTQVAAKSEKLTFSDVVWAAVVWFIQNILMLLGRARKQEDIKPKGAVGRIRRTVRRVFQFVSRPIIMIGILAGLIITCLTILFIFGKEKRE